MALKVVNTVKMSAQTDETHKKRVNILSVAKNNVVLMNKYHSSVIPSSGGEPKMAILVGCGGEARRWKRGEAVPVS
jgi:hypothetical protein